MPFTAHLKKVIISVIFRKLDTVQNLISNEMKNVTLTVMALLMLAVTGRVHAQDDAMMKAWQAYMTPGDVHKMIATADGKWDGEVTMWMAPGAAPSKSKSSCTNSMIFGGRYQKSMHTGNMMGMPFEGMSLLGYDNSKKVFVSNWIDNMGTGMMNMEGTWDDATKTINFKGKCVDPITGTDMDVREVFKFIDNNHQSMEMYSIIDGKEMKTMEIKLSRTK